MDHYDDGTPRQEELPADVKKISAQDILNAQLSIDNFLTV
jgi:hypothetical protein